MLRDRRKVEKEKETFVGQREMYYPARIACENPLYLLARKVEGGAGESPPPITHTPFEQFEVVGMKAVNGQ